MPEKRTIQRATKAKKEGKSPSTQAGAFVREEMEHIREGKHGARSAKQAIAIGLSKARRAGIPVKKNITSTSATGKQKAPVSKARSVARKEVLKKEPRSAASHLALSRQAHIAAKSRPATARSQAAKKATKTKEHAGSSETAKKATRARRPYTYRWY